LIRGSVEAAHAFSHAAPELQRHVRIQPASRAVAKHDRAMRFSYSGSSTHSRSFTYLAGSKLAARFAEQLSLAAEIEAIRYEIGGEKIELLVKLKVHYSVIRAALRVSDAYGRQLLLLHERGHAPDQGCRALRRRCQLTSLGKPTARGFLAGRMCS
jgi:hypothetical protein